MQLIIAVIIACCISLSTQVVNNVEVRSIYSSIIWESTLEKSYQSYIIGQLKKFNLIFSEITALYYAMISVSLLVVFNKIRRLFNQNLVLVQTQFEEPRKNLIQFAVVLLIVYTFGSIYSATKGFIYIFTNSYLSGQSIKLAVDTLLDVTLLLFVYIMHLKCFIGEELDSQ